MALLPRKHEVLGILMGVQTTNQMIEIRILRPPLAGSDRSNAQVLGYRNMLLLSYQAYNT